MSGSQEVGINKLTADTLLLPAQQIVGHEFAVSGILKANYETSYIEIESDRGLFKLQITDDKLINKMSRTVPGWVGGSYVYDDPVQIVGILGELNGQPCVSDVHSGVLSREDEGEYEF